jgi:hypothetical protein
MPNIYLLLVTAMSSPIAYITRCFMDNEVASTHLVPSDFVLDFPGLLEHFFPNISALD